MFLARPEAKEHLFYRPEVTLLFTVWEERSERPREGQRHGYLPSEGGRAWSSCPPHPASCRWPAGWEGSGKQGPPKASLRRLNSKGATGPAGVGTSGL